MFSFWMGMGAEKTVLTSSVTNGTVVRKTELMGRNLKWNSLAARRRPVYFRDFHSAWLS